MDDEQHARVEKFRRERQRQNTRILQAGHLGINRFFNLGEAAYREGALDAPTKEMMGLGISEAELVEAMNVALIVGGSTSSPTCVTLSMRSTCSWPNALRETNRRLPCRDQAGTQKPNKLPSPGALSKYTLPSWFLMAALTIDNPNPSPGISFASA
jgi:hypothetical protein